MRWRATYRCEVMEAEMLWWLWFAAGLGYGLAVQSTQKSPNLPECPIPTQRWPRQTGPAAGGQQCFSTVVSMMWLYPNF